MKWRFLFVLLGAFILSVLFFAGDLSAKPRRRVQRISGSHNIEKPMKVTGQTRTLSMMLVLKNKKEKIKFINVRKNYREEILKTEY